MSESDYLDLAPEAVSTAGRRTAQTSSTWGGWATRSETLLRNAAGGARQGKVTNAFETYLSRWNPKLKGLAVRADGLGTNAVSASYTVDQGDGDAAAIVHGHSGDAHSQASHLNRPINGPH